MNIHFTKYNLNIYKTRCLRWNKTLNQNVDKKVIFLVIFKKPVPKDHFLTNYLFIFKVPNMHYCRSHDCTHSYISNETSARKYTVSWRIDSTILITTGIFCIPYFLHTWLVKSSEIEDVTEFERHMCTRLLVNESFCQI